MGRVMDSYFLALTAIVTGTYSRMEVKGFGRIRYAYSFARSKHLLKEMYIADELLKHDLDGKPSVDIPSCPVLVFVDIKDEKLGGRLYNEFCYRLNKKQDSLMQENIYGFLEGIGK
ncbi:uncharacterized protein LOC103962605 isoform X2 [Pyrus x bretschneideri]|uniref:uncharacterized protein LOC103962605 isoform X2 n=1 Tax=Pyrus x bretschneideri TaxID=225117 RepID=UPI00202FE951|nr:uncharacterized protein LOC103962605 isoform X2 [Pyrus x bretschneideri]XP_048435571.1 uncharacterized protein LOC103962605 isoform X2 [Pyrus x bretschneideri]XP_048435572.1 uncharacterized protein LOC103962605 isoform X2 [Pyrus x bretschneideri]XP_048435573.1 uncharacterized protein LOC103962605 isoform X2 [Pyrus x bretschneideri]XP_048435574.1 uncharacterized protein LOC103962605 isoform X2 [Pyrus x bretschneideri]XP_048435575.1 uncharacterized protein LOC103962605 isoform X2 [Pyrus x bre